MKRRWIMLVGFAALAALAVVLFSRPDNRELVEVTQTRTALRQQGFKTDLSEFDFSASEELRTRAAAITNANLTWSGPRGGGDARRILLQEGKPELMTLIGSNAAMVDWRQAELRGSIGQNLWPVLRDQFAEEGALLDAACAATLSGPIRFHLNASAGHAMLLPHAAALKTLSQSLGQRAVLELHDRKNNKAWTNVLAATRLVTAWETEPAEVSHLVRYACAAITFQATWQMLQADGWTDEQLSRLQHEWEGADFFHRLPETAAFSRAAAVSTCQREREQPLSFSFTPTMWFRAPRQAWGEFKNYRQRIDYRRHGSYEDEQALLLYYRDRELDIQNALKCATWSAMRSLPGVTNFIPFKSKHQSSLLAMLNMRQMSLAVQGQGKSFLAKAAETETRRRLLLTAVALERFRLRQGSYPITLAGLVPGQLKDAPKDFMDGQPLRYRLAGDGRFILYSVGLDCVDNGGICERSGRRHTDPLDYDSFVRNSPRESDLVWPYPASAAEVQGHVQAEIQAQATRAEAYAQAWAERRREQEAERVRHLARLEKWVAQFPPRPLEDPTYQGRPLSEKLRNRNATNSPPLTLTEMLTPKQVVTGEEPDTATFEVPISYDAVTNLGMFQLLLDAGPEKEADGHGGELQELARATNGNCLLIWDTTYDSPGKHFLQAHLLVESGPAELSAELRGPWVPFLSTNVFQWDSMMLPAFTGAGVFFLARVIESNASYVIKIKSPTGELVKTLTGVTTNGMIDTRWDLIDDQGRAYTNDSLESTLDITFPKSDRAPSFPRP